MITHTASQEVHRHSSSEPVENSACVEHVQSQEILRLSSLLLDRQRQITDQLSRIDQLESALARMQHLRFGVSFEKHSDQGEIQFVDEAEVLVGDEPEAPCTTVKSNTRKGKSKKPPQPLPGSAIHPTLIASSIV